RYSWAGPSMWMGDIAAVLDTAFGPRGYRIPTRTLPYWLMWANARFDKTIRLALSYYGVPVLVSADKAKQELGWAPRPASESIVAAGGRLIPHRHRPPPRRAAPPAGTPRARGPHTPAPNTPLGPCGCDFSRPAPDRGH